MTDHAVDVLPACQCIIIIARANISGGEFSKNTLVRAIVYGILVEAQNALQYMRQRRNQMVRYIQ